MKKTQTVKRLRASAIKQLAGGQLAAAIGGAVSKVDALTIKQTTVTDDIGDAR